MVNKRLFILLCVALFAATFVTESGLSVHLLAFFSPSASSSSLPRLSGLKKANACIFALVQESRLKTFVQTVSMLEANFNAKHNYPYVILNQFELSSKFQETIRNLTRARVEFGIIDAKHWSVPTWINATRLNESVRLIGHGVDYRHMCRFMSGFFFRHELTLKYDYFMRIDSDSKFPCPIEKDPFRYLTSEGVLYAFVYATREHFRTIPSLWTTIEDWMRSINSDKEGAIENYGLNANGSSSSSFVANQHHYPCVFYNNFEIAAFSLFRSTSYLRFFDHLDRSGGFYHERWGDAPVRTYYVTIMLDVNRVRLLTDVPHNHQNHSIYMQYNSQPNCNTTEIGDCNRRWLSAASSIKSF